MPLRMNVARASAASSATNRPCSIAAPMSTQYDCDLGIRASQCDSVAATMVRLSLFVDKDPGCRRYRARRETFCRLTFFRDDLRCNSLVVAVIAIFVRRYHPLLTSISSWIYFANREMFAPWQVGKSPGAQ